jgi:hypothetical protein
LFAGYVELVTVVLAAEQRLLVLVLAHQLERVVLAATHTATRTDSAAHKHLVPCACWAWCSDRHHDVRATNSSHEQLQMHYKRKSVLSGGMSEDEDTPRSSRMNGWDTISVVWCGPALCVMRRLCAQAHVRCPQLPGESLRRVIYRVLLWFVMACWLRRQKVSLRRHRVGNAHIPSVSHRRKSDEGRGNAVAVEWRNMYE